jgi:hypothetical protein
VRTGTPDPKSDAALEEDLAVMSHILDKTIEELPGAQENGKRVMGIDVFFAPGSMPLRSLYLDNYGAVFFLNVNFPLVAPAEKQPEEKHAGDSTWEDARQELYGQRLQGGVVGEPAEEYSQEKVDQLKEKLLDTLKNATNIRGLKPDEYVTVWVSGGSSAGMARFWAAKPNPAVNRRGAILTTDPTASGARRTVLTIRASKSEIDAFASGKLSPEEFQKHARVTAYIGDSSGASADFLTVDGAGVGR